ncbi:MAG: CDP-diacylglycerol--serine O-phosphatidyltransferase [Chloroflexota bacterium]|nr:CDP-diacylglycerol--serine O-phosphatidyltransferase [Chloroflexota bacterium]
MRSPAPGRPHSAPVPVNWIPHALSLCGLACGFLSLIASAAHDFPPAAALIIAAIFFDGFDGAAARALHCDGPLGEMLDSLADLAAFGIAPAFLAYQAVLENFGLPGALTGAMFAGCGAIRLARFPLVKNPRYFVGLPIPMAGAFVAMLGAVPVNLAPELVPVAIILVALLMVSTIEFPKFSTAFGPLPAPVRWALCLALAPLLFVVARWAILGLLVLYLSLGAAGALRLALERDRG